MKSTPLPLKSLLLCIGLLLTAGGLLGQYNITYPPDYDGNNDGDPWGWEPALECDASCDHYGSNPNQWNTLDNGHPSPDDYNSCFGTGTPSSSCSGFATGYSDTRHDYCDGSYLIIRTWHTWCGGQLFEHDQKIKVQDTKAPWLDCPDDIYTSVGYGCDNEIHLPKPAVEDACSWTFSYKLWFGGQTVVRNGEYYAINVQEGTHLVKWTVKDDCGNSADCSYFIHASKGGGGGTPTAVCVRYVNVWIIGESSHVYAESFDDGSNSDCGPVYLKVRRDDKGGPFDDFVKFDCADHEKHISVNLRVYSVDPGPGPVDPKREEPGGDLYGNYNDCWSDAYVKIKDMRRFQCPPDEWIGCNEDFNYSEWASGDDIIKGNSGCLPDNYDVTVEVVEPEDCGTYGRHYKRIFTVRDENGYVIFTCTQRIFIKDDNPFTICDTECRDAPVKPEPWVCYKGGHTLTDGVEWPCDIMLDDCGYGLSPEELKQHPDPRVRRNAEPEFFDAQCAMLAYTYDDQILNKGKDGCQKIIRTWTVADWCQFEIIRRGGGGEFIGLWRYIQIIKVKDAYDPTISCQDTIDVTKEELRNVVINGDFEMGNTMFETEYSYGRRTAQYMVAPDAKKMHPYYLSGQDHTSGDGNFLIVNGDTSQLMVWCQKIQVTPFTQYDFSAWVNNIAAPDSSNTNEPMVVFTANGQELVRSDYIPQNPDAWIELTALWQSQTFEEVQLCAYAETMDERGNNFGIDDIRMIAQSKCKINPQNGCEVWANIEIPEAEDNCTENLSLSWAIDLQYEEKFKADLSGTGDPSGYYPQGWHKIRWSVEDDCRNKSYCYSVFYVRECKEPTPYCYNGLSTVVMPSTGTLTLDADVFDLGSYDNCTAQEDLEILIRRTDSGDPFRPTISLGCDDIPNGVRDTILVDVLVRDQAGNEDYCQTYLIFQDTPDEDLPEGICPDAEDLTNDQISLRSSRAQPITAWELYQNNPNPFIDQTTILVELPTAQAIDFVLYDLSGKVILNKKINAPTPQLQILLTDDDFNGKSGVFYYEVRSAQGTLSKKMLKLK